MKRIDIPYKFKLRKYQEDVWEKYFHDGIRHFCLVWHRRAGKSKLAVNIIAAASQMRVGAYYYFFPYLTQAKAAIWDGRGSDGVKFVDHFPPELIHKVNNADMKIYFKNGSLR
jgi:hypothetical protein